MSGVVFGKVFDIFRYTELNAEFGIQQALEVFLHAFAPLPLILEFLAFHQSGFNVIKWTQSDSQGQGEKLMVTVGGSA